MMYKMFLPLVYPARVEIASIMKRRDFLKFAALIPGFPAIPKMLKSEPMPFVDVPQVPDDWDRFKDYCHKLILHDPIAGEVQYIPGEWLRPVFDAYQSYDRVIYKKYWQGNFSNISRQYACWRAKEFGERWLYVGDSSLHTCYSIEGFQSNGLVYSTQKPEFPNSLVDANIIIDGAAWLKNGGIGGIPGPKAVGDDPWPMARKVFVFSVPYRRSGWFYHVYHHALAGHNPYYVVPTNYKDCGAWNSEKLSRFREFAYFRQEFLAEWPV